MFPLSCPNCSAPLALNPDNPKNLRCAAGHSFDAAKQGYWNLLLANKKRSKDPGDNAEMVMARRDFLELGRYQGLSDAISELAAECLSETTDACILDMGCGEGYYTSRLEQHLQTAGLSFQLAGLDISKHAVKAACRRNKNISWLVASGANMPVADGQLDLLSVAFSRLMPEEFARTLKAGGHLLIAYPGEQHLRQLRELIYKDVRQSGFAPAELLQDNFTELQTRTVSYDFSLNSQQQISQLLAMTPHGWRIKQDVREELARLDKLTLTLDVKLALFQRKGSD